ncbi:unnamed protein product, partial [Diplocarpon coronariae]
NRPSTNRRRPWGIWRGSTAMWMPKGPRRTPRSPRTTRDGRCRSNTWRPSRRPSEASQPRPPPRRRLPGPALGLGATARSRSRRRRRPGGELPPRSPSRTTHPLAKRRMPAPGDADRILPVNKACPLLDPIDPPPPLPPRSASAANDLPAHAPPPVSGARPNTGGSMTSSGSRPGSLALRDRGSYSQPAAPTVAGTNAQGRMSQPKNKHYHISGPMFGDEPDLGRPSANQVPAKFARVSGLLEGSATAPPDAKGHKRSNTIGGIFGRTNPGFGATRDKPEKPEKGKRSYPPVSKSGAAGPQDTPRQSMDSRRSISFGFGKKASGSMTGGSQTPTTEKPRRFSLLPASFSLKAIGIGKEYGTPGAPPDGRYDDRPPSHGDDAYPPPTAHTTDGRSMSGATAAAPYAADGIYDRGHDSPRERREHSTLSPVPPQHPPPSHGVPDPRSGAPPPFPPHADLRPGDSATNTESETSLSEPAPRRAAYPPGVRSYDDPPARQQAPQPSPGSNQPPPSRAGRGVLQKNNRRFGDAYEPEPGNGYGPIHSDHAGSSGAARKVMDFFRRRGRDRGQ